jgi:hypothetical protein
MLRNVGTASGMRISDAYFWRPAVLVGIGLALGACGTTYGTGVNPGTQTVKDLTGMLNFGSGDKGEPIDYAPRPGIVTPPANSALPEPGSGTAVADWPDDPDVRAREQKLANANKPSESSTALVDPGFRLPKSQVQVDQLQDENIDDELYSLTGNKTEQRKLFATAKGGAAGKVDENGNPIRTVLTEPPAEYRVPDPTAPEEFEATSKRGLGSIFKKKPSSVAPSTMGGGTDDIADPNVSTASQE